MVDTRDSHRSYRALIVSIAAVGALSAAGGCSAQSPVSAAPSQAALACEEPIHDVGDVHDNKLSHEFLLTNVSTAPVRIAKIGKSCACANVEVFGGELPPGESTTVAMEVEINSRHAGSVTEFGEELKVILAGDTKPALTLRLQGRYIPVAYKLTNRVNIPGCAWRNRDTDYRFGRAQRNSHPRKRLYPRFVYERRATDGKGGVAGMTRDPGTFCDDARICNC